MSNDTNEILKKLCNYNTHEVDEVPEGWLTIEDFSKVWNLSVRQTSHRVTALFKAKVLEIKDFRIATGITRKVIRVNHYRVRDAKGCLTELKKSKHRQ